MKAEIIILPEARAELTDAFRWYEDQISGLGSRFFDSFEKTLSFISRFPRGRPKVLEEIRRANLTGFPFAIFYVYEENEVRVLAIQHQARITDQRIEELF